MTPIGTVSNCQACRAYEAAPLSGSYVKGCKACAVRALALSPIYAASRSAGRLSREYRDTLSLMFDGAISHGHDIVKAAYEQHQRRIGHGRTE